MTIYTRIGSDHGPTTYGIAVAKGEEPITYDPLTREGYAHIARIWGTKEAEEALKAVLPKPWEIISTHIPTEITDEMIYERYPPVIAYNGERTGEAVIYFSNEWDFDKDCFVNIVEYRWANDSCSCCWRAMDPQPIAWRPMPTIES